MATAQVIYNRVQGPEEELRLLGSLLVACKLNESWVRVRDLVNCYIWDTRGEVEYDVLKYFEYKHKAILGEKLVLEGLNNELARVSCYKHYMLLVNLAHSLGLERELLQLAWSYLNERY